MTVDDSLLAALADELIPADHPMPCASRAGVPGLGLDTVLRTRPDLVAPLDALLQQARDLDPSAAISHLREQDPSAFGVLASVVAGGYLQNPRVQRLLGYPGREAAPLGDLGPTSEFEAELLAPVRARGRRYRPTPLDAS